MQRRKPDTIKDMVLFCAKYAARYPNRVAANRSVGARGKERERESGEGDPYVLAHGRGTER